MDISNIWVTFLPIFFSEMSADNNVAFTFHIAENSALLSTPSMGCTVQVLDPAAQRSAMDAMKNKKLYRVMGQLMNIIKIGCEQCPLF